MATIDNTIKCHCGEAFGSAYHRVLLCVYGSETHVVCEKCANKQKQLTKKSISFCHIHKGARLVPFTHFWKKLYSHTSHANNAFAKKDISSNFTVSVGHGRSYIIRKAFQLDILTGFIEFDYGLPIRLEVTFGKVDSLTIKSLSDALELTYKFEQIEPGTFNINTESFPKKLYLVTTYVNYSITT